MLFVKSAACAALVLGAASAQAFTLAFPYGGGHVGSATGSNSFSVVTDPMHLDSSSADAQTLATGFETLFGGSTTTFGSDISGTMNFDKLLAQTINRGGGVSWDARLTTTESLTNTYWVVFQATSVNGAPPSYAFLFRNLFGDTSPHFYNAADEAAHRNGSDAFGGFSYRFENQILSSITGNSPYTISKNWSAFLVDDTTSNGQRSFVIHDGVNFVNTFGAPAPEPASLLALALGSLLCYRGWSKSSIVK